MKTVFIALVGLILLAAGFAADEGDWMKAPDGFVWPVHVAVQPQEGVEVSLAELPEGIRGYLNDQYSPEKPPQAIYVHRADLNGDKVPEWFVDFPESGGSGGSVYEILVLTGKTVRGIGALQGGFQLCVAAPGEKWLRIEGSSRAGGGCFTRYLLQYRKGGYDTVRNEDHDFPARKVTVRQNGVGGE